MQNRNMDELSDYVIDQMCIYFKGRFNNFCVRDLYDNDHNKSFSINLIAYEYFPVIFTYDRGRIGCSICFGNMTIGLRNSQQWWDEADFDVFFAELQKELELRIPDKFLEAHGWL